MHKKAIFGGCRDCHFQKFAIKKMNKNGNSKNNDFLYKSFRWKTAKKYIFDLKQQKGSNLELPYFFYIKSIMAANFAMFWSLFLQLLYNQICLSFSSLQSKFHVCGIKHGEIILPSIPPPLKRNVKTWQKQNKMTKRLTLKSLKKPSFSREMLSVFNETIMRFILG